MLVELIELGSNRLIELIGDDENFQRLFVSELINKIFIGESLKHSLPLIFRVYGDV